MWLALLVFIEIGLMGGVIAPHSKVSLFSKKGDFHSLLATYNAARKPQQIRGPGVRSLERNDKIESCDDVKEAGVYSIQLAYFDKPVDIRCEVGFDKSKGNWMVMQRRLTGDLNFYRNWEDYKWGFGDLEGEFFYGLEFMYNITNQEPMQLGIILRTKSGRKGHAIYDQFEIGDEEDNYRIVDVGSMVGNIGDALKYHLNQQFSTYDRKNDGHNDENCAVSYRGGWWYRKCYQANLNGVYPFDRKDCAHCARWNTFNKKKPLQFMMMALRKRKNSTLEDPPWAA